MDLLLKKSENYFITQNCVENFSESMFESCPDKSDSEYNFWLWVKTIAEKNLEGKDRKKEILIKLAEIDARYRTPKTIADACWGDLFALKRLEEADKLSVKLKNELKELSSN